MFLHSKCTRRSGNDLYLPFEITLLAEISSIILLITNIMYKMTKIVTFSDPGSSIPLYEEKVTIDKSNTITIVKVKMKTSDVFLFSKEE
ncbi:MAG TPA: hypothetical protein VEL11_16580 [Candidatus Bathyarchaeia archaeon]|nr:hypothetical protein [Candidatus Bathyarchaeia archaeon]